MTPGDAGGTALARMLKALAKTEASVEIPPRVEAAILARWDAAHAPRVGSSRAALVRGAAATAAGVTLVAALTLERRPGRVDVALPVSPLTRAAVLSVAAPPVLPTATRPVAVVHRSSEHATAARAAPDERTTVYLVGGPVAADEAVRVVRMRVDSSTLRELGLASDAQSTTVDIDVLVGEDGVARVVRMVM
jgi:hypothetical protein